MSTKKENTNVENVTEQTSKPIKPNEVKTQESFASTNMLDMIAVNNELMSLNQGELRFKVTEKSEYIFPKKDKDGNIETDDLTGEVINIHSPYVEIVGEGVNGKLSTKKLNKDEIEMLQVGKDYIATYLLTENLDVKITHVVPFNQELQTRVKHLNNGN